MAGLIMHLCKALSVRRLDSCPDRYLSSNVGYSILSMTFSDRQIEGKFLL